MGRGGVFTGFWFGGPKVRDHWEDLGVGGRITLRWTLERSGRWGELDSPGSRQGAVAGFCEHGNEPLGSIRRWDIFDKLSNSFSNNILHHGVSE
jgi:hypothetical protein